MDSQTFKITIFLGLAVILALIAFLALGVTKDFAFAFGGKFGLTDKGDEKTFVTNPGDVNVKLTCERNQKQLENAQFLYKIKIKDAKLQSEGKDDIRPVLYFKSTVVCTEDPAEIVSGKCTKNGIIPKEQIKTGNVGELNFELETAILPTYTKEFYTLFLLKKSDKCENALAGAINEQILVSQCSRDLLAKFDASTNSCTREELPYIKLESIETRIEKGVNECRPVFKVINNDRSAWTTELGRGYKVIVRNCEMQSSSIKDFQKSSGIKDVVLPDLPGAYIEMPSGGSQNSGPRNNLMRSLEGHDIFCKSGGEKKIEVYKDCLDDIGKKELFCTNLYRPELFPKDALLPVPKPVLIQSVPFTC